MNNKGTCRMSVKWWKDTGILIGLMTIVYAAMWVFEKEYHVPGQGSCVIDICYLILLVLIVLFFVHLCRPGLWRNLVAMLITAFVNRNREAVPPKEIADKLGVEKDVVDKKIAKIANSELEEKSCSNLQAKETDFSLEILKKIAPHISSWEEFFDEVEVSGAKNYYSVLRRLIRDEKSDFSIIYRIMYEIISDTDQISFDIDEPTYRKENLKCLIKCRAGNGRWQFYCSYIGICYKEEEYDSIIECAQDAIKSIGDEDCHGPSRRAYVYALLGSIYLEHAQYSYAISYFEGVLQNSAIRVPALYRLAYIYILLHDYQKCLYYARLCFSELSDYDNAELLNSMEYNLTRWIAYCTAACGEFEDGVSFVENYLVSASSKITKGEQNEIESCLTYLLTKVGKWDKAYALSKKVLNHDPMDVTSVNVKGMYEMRSGHYDTAINCFVSIIPVFKKEKTKQGRYYLGEIYNNLAICEAKQGMVKESDEHFRVAFDCGYPFVDILQFAKVARQPLGIQDLKKVQEDASKSA